MDVHSVLRCAINFVAQVGCCGSIPCCVILCCVQCPATDVHSVLRCVIRSITQRSKECTSVARHCSQHNITQHGMLPQHPTGTAKLICDYF